TAAITSGATNIAQLNGVRPPEDRGRSGTAKGRVVLGLAIRGGRLKTMVPAPPTGRAVASATSHGRARVCCPAPTLMSSPAATLVAPDRGVAPTIVPFVLARSVIEVDPSGRR